MTVDAILESLGAEAGAALRAVLRKAYERGYREGLATRPGDEGVSPAPAPAKVVFGEAPIADDEQAAPSAEEVAPAGVLWEPDEEEDDPDPEERRRGDGDRARPIHSLATVGTLKNRIVKVFALDRFDIDVVICRKGDRDRRQLRGDVRLASYLVEP